MGPQQPQESMIDGYKKQVNTVRNLATIVSFPVELFTTRLGTWGSHYLTVFPLLGLVWPLIFSAFYGPHEAAGEVIDFWVVCLALLAAHFAAGQKRRKEGYRCHSRFWGHSWFDRRTGVESQRKARLCDGLIAFAVGFLFVASGSAPLGTLILIGAVGKLIADGMEFQASEARVRQMEDGRIETQTVGEIFRQRNG